MHRKGVRVWLEKRTAISIVVKALLESWKRDCSGSSFCFLRVEDSTSIPSSPNFSRPKSVVKRIYRNRLYLVGFSFGLDSNIIGQFDRRASGPSRTI